MTATAPPERPRADCAFTLAACRDQPYVPRHLGLTRLPSRRLRAAASAALSFPEPESWLDVGTGYARFPEVAKELFPYTAFDGLDPTYRVLHARVAERVEEAHVGNLTDARITARLRARYDIVSMFRHLEHTPDPREELRAALTVLRPGGLLLLELPDPRCVFALLLGRWWTPHSRPGHLHLLPLDTLRQELQSQGCTILSTDRRTPHIPYDLAATTSRALALVLPWPLSRACAPLVAVAWALDHILAPVLRHTRFSNTYRVVARKEPTARA
ncbi:MULTISPECIES: class I SAM-dependent methyltransferase [unclassified Streptomyces]|uniref:class I SAM-dependent methyltransferase n=1 Tax=unclassified Streptomyces TaxID=2593676 RepID=UPI00236633F2|nr:MULTISPECIES: class I SAM-dependent methyltransferase [unclassified Streptomyces]MDF3148172.1 class I SAM-dependent methyltransferase [Streptomyces sp. T21Q-yed]WDF37535.1 class I SAM-dependent methyltransferase [Streptomyces sp. T12]